MRVALAQLNPIVGDVPGNLALVEGAMQRARDEDADILVCPEMMLLGYPPRDLLFRQGVIEACQAAVHRVAQVAGSLTVVVGHPRRAPGGLRGVRNSVSVCRAGAVLAVCDKQLLPGYDVFDEDRYFDSGSEACCVDLPSGRVGVLICEDLWRAGDVHAEPRYAVDPVATLVECGCELLVAANASPFIVGKAERHLAQAREVARRFSVPIVAVNQVGGQDDLVFDGRSFAVDGQGVLRQAAPGFAAAVTTVDLDDPAERVTPSAPDDDADLVAALRLGVRDYCRKSGVSNVLVGLSGGIDSALTATIAALALGSNHVHGVLMPSRYSSPGSRTDALALAERLALGSCETIEIESVHGALRSALGITQGLADENIQARVRGLLLMARSNESGALLLATSNKSELAVGYSTLYGDMCGAIAVLGDVPKTRVYRLARYVNTHADTLGLSLPPIPEASITKTPSAELRPDQTDQDTLPPYDVLDTIIEHAVELEHAADQIVEMTGYERGLVERVVTMIDRTEYKRYQAALILKVTHRTFGRGRPMPLVMRDHTRLGVEPDPRRTRRTRRETT